MKGVGASVGNYVESNGHDNVFVFNSIGSSSSISSSKNSSSTTSIGNNSTSSLSIGGGITNFVGNQEYLGNNNNISTNRSYNTHNTVNKYNSITNKVSDNNASKNEWIVLEIDGPQHFMWNKPRMPTGKTVSRDRIL